MSIPSLSSHLIASASCYRHDYLVTDRRSTATLICDGAARSCFHMQASLSRSVIGPAGQPCGGSKQIAESERDTDGAGVLVPARRSSGSGYARPCCHVTPFSCLHDVVSKGPLGLDGKCRSGCACVRAGNRRQPVLDCSR